MKKVKIKRYIDCYIATETCNLRCKYCYIAQHNKFNNKLFKFPHTPEFIRKALSVERLGGVCLLNLCAGGETLLSKDVIKITEQLLQEGHYVMIVTNGTLTKRFEEIAKFQKELLDRLFFKFSFHYLELKRLKMLDIYFKNIEMMKKAGASFTVEITPNDDLIPYIDEIKEVSMKKLGALPHITIARKDSNDIPVLSEYSLEDYVKIWGVFDSEMINFKSKIYGTKRKEFCYAGEWSFYLNLMTGSLSQCYRGLFLDNIYNDISKPIKTLAIGHNCKQPHCYNGHTFLTLGDIPEMDSPTYDKLRNRTCKDGSKWLSKSMEKCMQCKLKECNREYTTKEKKQIDIRNKTSSITNVPRYIYNNKIKKYKNQNEYIENK